MNTCIIGSAHVLRRLVLAQLCLLACLPFAAAQTAPAAPAPTRADGANVPVVADDRPADPKSDEVLQLSPFEVVADTKGYYSANTMSGTRFNTKLSDLASSITVMTKEQMSDFAMLDINDVFLYVAGTEGTGTYTDYVIDRNGSIADNVQLNPTNANRVRGIAPANVSLGNVETMNRVPIDVIEVEGIEVSRGPNANVFGLGNPSGTVNQVPTTANLTRDRARAGFRVDSYGGWRTSLDVNRVLLKGKLAIRGTAVYQEEAFVRKPSGVTTERYKGMIKYQPFKNTTITASAAYYHMYGNRPNALPPRDSISYWVQSGKPTWDPVTRTIHVNGTSIGPITATAFPTTFGGSNVDYFSAGWLGATHNQMYIDQTGLTYWSAPQGFSNTTPLAGASTAGPTSGGQSYRLVQPTSGPGLTSTTGKAANQPLFATTPTINDKSIYDWSEINVSAPNRIWDTMTTSNVQLDQLLLNTPIQTLAVQLAFMREDSERFQRNLIGIANDLGQSGQLTVDVNERRLDGTPNPYFLRPYIGTDKPRTVYAPAKWDTSRVQVAYRLDLTREKNLLKWLGWFQATGYGEYKYRVNRQYSYRDAMASDVSWIPPGVWRGNQSIPPSSVPALVAITQGFYRYYVGDNSGNNVDYAPGNFSSGTYPFSWGNGATNTFRSEDIELAPVAATDNAGGNSNTKIVLRTNGAVIQNHLLNDRLVVTLGVRNDTIHSKFGTLTRADTINPDGKTYNYAVVNSWQAEYRSNKGRTTNYQIVLRPFEGLSFVNRMDHGGGGHFFAGLLNGMAFTYNRSNSFLPSTPAQDIFRNPLPNPTGAEKSYGIGLRLLDDKLVIRATHYDNTQINSRNGDANAFLQRVSRADVNVASTTPSRFVLENVAGAITPNAANYNRVGWIKTLNPGFTDQQVNDALATLMQLPLDYMGLLRSPTPPLAATNDIQAIGTEIEINYNPTKYWTLSASITDARTKNQNISKTIQQWIDQRMPVWTTIVDPTITDAEAAAEGNPNKLWWNHRYPSATQTPAQNFEAFVRQPFSVIQQLEGKSNPQVRRYNFRGSTNLQLAGISDNQFLKRMSVGGSFRWEAKGAIGYLGMQSLPATITDLDTNRPVYDKGHYYVDLFATYKTKLWRDKIGASFQLNVRNLGENGRLQPVNAFPDGSISAFRIIDPQLFLLTVSFDL